MSKSRSYSILALMGGICARLLGQDYVSVSCNTVSNAVGGYEFRATPAQPTMPPLPPTLWRSMSNSIPIEQIDARLVRGLRYEFESRALGGITYRTNGANIITNHIASGPWSGGSSYMLLPANAAHFARLQITRNLATIDSGTNRYDALDFAFPKTTNLLTVLLVNTNQP